MTNRPQQFKSKAAFIRDQGLTASADAIIAAGKQHGLKIKRQDVHNVRHHEKQKAAANGGDKPTKGKPKPKPAPNRDVMLELEFRKVAIRLGVERAHELLDELMAEVAL